MTRVARIAAIILWCVCAAPAETTLTLWIIPIENAGPGQITAGEEIVKRVDEFNQRFSGSRVVVENTTDPVLKMQLLSWNPAFAVPNAAVVTSQIGTVRELERYAARANVNIRVRFITWDEAFKLISGLNPGAKTAAYPDVIQIGSTWLAYIADRGLIMSRPNWLRDRGNWIDSPGLPASGLPYFTDVRLLFYWKRLPSDPPSEREFVLNTSSWTALVDSIRERAGRGDTIAFPTGLTLNVLHDYAPLVWAGGGTFFSRGWLGWRVHLTSPAALAVPFELQRSAIEMPVPGQPRTLITFPESSHEEVDRVFVNGGYRVTLEPANFIDRWRQDFQRRHANDGLRFWDYAAAAVPPKSFKGGSEIVVTRGTAIPQAAFALADFLAGDPGFTRILAESGFLPSGRRGYGTDILTDSLYRATGSLGEVEHFVDSVQKAIEQGQEYPPFPGWPIEIENQRVEEAFQVIWRRMGERDPEKLRLAAKEAEWLINSRVSWFDELRYAVIEARWAFLAILLVGCSGAGYLFYRRIQAERALTLLLFLYRAYRHDAAKFLGDNFFGLASAADSGSLACSEFIGKVRALSVHFKDLLTPHIERIAEGQFNDYLRKGPGLTLGEISDMAFAGATYIYEAKELQAVPEVRYATSGLDQWRIARMPFSLVVALEEWFLNFIKFFIANGYQSPALLVNIEGKELRVESTGSLTDQQRKTLMEKPGMQDLNVGRQGLKLIRNILYYAYGVRVCAEGGKSKGGELRVYLRIPLHKHLKRS